MTTPQQMTPQQQQQGELFALAGIAGVLRWIEELAAILSGPLLTTGLAIALVDLLTDGALLASQPELLYAWAISQAIGVDAQLVAAWDKARQALRTRRYWALVGLLILGVALAYVGYLAAIVFAMQQSAGISTAEALRQLGMDSATWLVSRAALSVILVCLSGWTRYHAPAKASLTLDDERAQLQRELELEPLRAQLRQRKAVGWRDLGRSIVQGDAAPAPAEPFLGHDTYTRAQDNAQPEDVGERSVVASSALAQASSAPLQREEEPSASASASDRGPTDPGSPASKRPPRQKASKRPPRADVLRLVPDTTATTTAEQRIRAALADDPALSIRALAKRARVSSATASKYARLVRSEAQAAAAGTAGRHQRAAQ